MHEKVEKYAKKKNKDINVIKQKLRNKYKDKFIYKQQTNKLGIYLYLLVTLNKNIFHFFSITSINCIVKLNFNKIYILT